MKRISTALVLIASISSAFTADNLLVNWSSDDDALPEALPRKMRDKSDDDVQKAVFQAYENQLKVISEYNGHVLDSESLGYLKDEMPISNARTSNPQSDLVFFNNAIRGLIGQNKNSQIVKWVPNQVITEIGWKELSVRGRYTFMNASYFDQGKYLILLQDVKYLAVTTLSGNTEEYPSTVPKTSISYKSVKVTFTGGLPELLKTSDNSNVKHFIEDILFQQVADRVVKDTHSNTTAAIRQAVRPYILFKNDTDRNFPGVSSKTYTIGAAVISGFANAEHKLKKVTAKTAAGTVTADLRVTVHGLAGGFDYKLDEGKPPAAVAGKATFTVGRVDIGVTVNMLKPAECKTEVTVVAPVVKYTGGKLSADGEKTLTTAFVDNVKSQLNGSVCKTFSQMFKPGK